MRIDVALLPGQRFDAVDSVCVVVDVLRASSTIVTLLERGCEEVVASADVAEARRLSERLPGHLLCGEQGAVPDGFDHGNSPAEFSRLNLSGKSVILTTSNGTRTMAALAAAAPAILVGCLLNRAAVARAALGIAVEGRHDIAIVCAGAGGSTKFVLEDGLGAGAIVDAVIALDPAFEVTDAAMFARDAFSAAQARIGDAIRSAHHAQELVDEGLGEDVAYCAQLDVSSVAPVLERAEDGVLRLRPWSDR